MACEWCGATGCTDACRHEMTDEGTCCPVHAPHSSMALRLAIEEFAKATLGHSGYDWGIDAFAAPLAKALIEADTAMAAQVGQPCRYSVDGAIETARRCVRLLRDNENIAMFGINLVRDTRRAGQLVLTVTLTESLVADFADSADTRATSAIPVNRHLAAIFGEMVLAKCIRAMDKLRGVVRQPRGRGVLPQPSDPPISE